MDKDFYYAVNLLIMGDDWIFESDEIYNFFRYFAAGAFPVAFLSLEGRTTRTRAKSKKKTWKGLALE